MKLGEEAVDPKDDPYGMYLHRKKSIQGDIVLGYNVKTSTHETNSCITKYGNNLFQDITRVLHCQK